MGPVRASVGAGLGYSSEILESRNENGFQVNRIGLWVSLSEVAAIALVNQEQNTACSDVLMKGALTVPHKYQGGVGPFDGHADELTLEHAV